MKALLQDGCNGMILATKVLVVDKIKYASSGSMQRILRNRQRSGMGMANLQGAILCFIRIWIRRKETTGKGEGRGGVVMSVFGAFCRL